MAPSFPNTLLHAEAVFNMYSKIIASMGQISVGLVQLMQIQINNHLGDHSIHH